LPGAARSGQKRSGVVIERIEKQYGDAIQALCSRRAEAPSSTRGYFNTSCCARCSVLPCPASSSAFSQAAVVALPQAAPRAAGYAMQRLPFTDIDRLFDDSGILVGAGLPLPRAVRAPTWTSPVLQHSFIVATIFRSCFAAWIRELRPNRAWTRSHPNEPIQMTSRQRGAPVKEPATVASAKCHRQSASLAPAQPRQTPGFIFHSSTACERWRRCS